MSSLCGLTIIVKYASILKILSEIGNYKIVASLLLSNCHANLFTAFYLAEAYH
jgi:hypothetical protein